MSIPTLHMLKQIREVQEICPSGVTSPEGGRAKTETPGQARSLSAFPASMFPAQ